MFLVFLFWVDDEVDRPVFDACDSGELPHVDSAADGFTDDKFAVVFWHRFKGHHVTPAKLVEAFAGFAVGHAALLDQGVWLNVPATDVEHHFAQLVPRQRSERQLMCTDGL